MQYNVQDPQGNNRVIEGPDGASDEEIIAQAKNLFGHSGGMPADTGSLDPIRRAIANASLNKPQPIPGAQNPVPYSGPSTPQNGYNEDIKYGNANDATVGDAANIYSLYKTPEAVQGLYSLGKAGVSKAAAFLSSLKEAPAIADSLVPTETAMESGQTIKNALETGNASRGATATAQYNSIPKDLKLPLKTTQDTADSVINAVKELPKSFQSNKIVAIAGDLQDMEHATVGTIQSMNSTLKDIAYNGEGVEKVYAAQLSKALQTDLETFGKSSVLSQEPTLEANALRNKWFSAAKEQNNMTNDVIDKGISYVRPDAVSGSTALTNSDIPTGVKDANRYYQYKAYLEQHPLNQALQKANLEAASNVIFKGKSVEDLNTAKLLLGNQGFQSAQAQFVGKLASAKDISGALAKYTPEYLNAAIGPQKVAQLQAVAHFNALKEAAIKAAKIGVPAAGTAVGAYELFKH